MNQENLPKAKITLDEVINQSFKYWKATLKFQLIFSVLYLSIAYILNSFLLKYFGINEELNNIIALGFKDFEMFIKKFEILISSNNYKIYEISLIASMSLIYPLNIGFFRVYTLFDEKKYISTNEIFDGFKGSTFFKLLGYFLFWGTFNYFLKKYFFPASFLWVFLTVFVGPLLYFTPMRMLEAINISAKVAWANWTIVLPCAIIAFLFSYSGFILFFVGFLFTYPFWNAIIYTLFKRFFSIKFV